MLYFLIINAKMCIEIVHLSHTAACGLDTYKELHYAELCFAVLVSNLCNVRRPSFNLNGVLVFEREGDRIKLFKCGYIKCTHQSPNTSDAECRTHPKRCSCIYSSPVILAAPTLDVEPRSGSWANRDLLLLQAKL